MNVNHEALTQYLQELGPNSDGEPEMYRYLFASAPVAMAISTPEGRFMHVNAAFCQMLGYTEDEILSEKVIVTHPDSLNPAPHFPPSHMRH